MELNSKFIDSAKQYVVNVLKSELPKNCLFHSIRHTLDVTENVVKIGRYRKLNEDDINILRLAGLFHDVGYVSLYAGHEELSASMAWEYLEKSGMPQHLVETVTSAILATKVPQSPTSIYAEILCDADLMHLTYHNYFELMELMRQEWELMNIRSLDEKEFHLNSVDFFNNHKYHTEFGLQILEPQKKITLERIKKRISEL